MTLNMANSADARPRRESPRDSAHWFLLAIILIASIAPKFFGLSIQSFWIDEINIIRYTNHPFLDVRFFEAIRGEPHPPLYFVLIWCWRHLFGIGETALRLSSAVAASGGVLLCYRMVGTTWGRSVGLMATALFGMSSASLYEAQNARPYALVMTISLVSTVLFLRLLRERPDSVKAGSLLPLCATNFVLCMLHYAGVIFIAGEALLLGLWLMPQSLQRGVFFAVLCGVPALSACAWIIWNLGAFHATPEASGVIHAVRLTDVISPVRSFFGQPTLLILAIVPLLALGSWSALLSWLRATGQNARAHFNPARQGGDAATGCREDLWPLLGLVMLQYLLVLAAAQVHPSWMQNKNIYPAFPAGYIALALILSRARMLAPPIGERLATAVSAVSLVSYLVTGYPLQQASFYSPYREQIREGARLLIDLARPHDTVMFGAVDMSAGGDAHTLLVEPTRIYVSLLETSGHLLKATDLKSLPPDDDPVARRAALEEVVAQRNPQGSIIIDLPHGSGLSRADRDYLVGVSACLGDKRLINQEVVVVHFTPDECRGLPVEIEAAPRR